jgi:hypothetical protein
MVGHLEIKTLPISLRIVLPLKHLSKPSNNLMELRLLLPDGMV